ncbi:hypothetical protein NAB68_18590, partial [Proteus mirabilis]|nr:hypothetical protein [Proteus mirabilis]
LVSLFGLVNAVDVNIDYLIEYTHETVFFSKRVYGRSLFIAALSMLIYLLGMQDNPLLNCIQEHRFLMIMYP